MHNFVGRGLSSELHLPGQITGTSNVQKYSVGGSHVAAIKSDRTLRVWKFGVSGRLGTGNTNNLNQNTSWNSKQFGESIYR